MSKCGKVEKIRHSLECLKDFGDSQLQTTFLHSCLSLPKFNYSLQKCPPSLILNATTTHLGRLWRMSLEIPYLVGPGLRPTFLWRLNLIFAVLHTPATYISSIVESVGLVSQILRHIPGLYYLLFLLWLPLPPGTIQKSCGVSNSHFHIHFHAK